MMNRLVPLMTVLILAWASSARATPFHVFYTHQLTPEAQSAFEDRLREAYQFVSSRLTDPVDRHNCLIEIHFADLQGRTGFTPKSRDGCHDVILLESSLEGDWIASASLAHELVHVFRHHANPNEVAWLDEGIAKQIEYEYVKIWPQEVFGAEASNAFALDENLDDYTAGSAAYLKAFLFIHYLARHLGDDAFVAAIVHSKLAGWNAIEEAAKATVPAQQIGIPFARLTRNDLWTHFAFALRLNDSSIADNGLFEIDPLYASILKPEAPRAGENSRAQSVQNISARAMTWTADLGSPGLRVYAIHKGPALSLTHIESAAAFSKTAADEFLVIRLP